MTIEIHAWLADAITGFYVGEIDSFGSSDTFAIFAANAAKNGQIAIDKTVKTNVRPPAAPAVAPPVDPLKATYAAALTDTARLDAIATKLGLK